MSVSTTVVSTRILRPAAILFSCAISTTRKCSFSITSGPSCRARFPIVRSSGTFSPPDPGELAIDQIGAHFPRQRFVTPVAHVLQQQHSEYDVRRRRLTATRLALLAAFGQLLLD